MTWGRAVLVALDQLGNALAGGKPDVTISARLGYLSYHRPTPLGRFLAIVVDLTFYPIDGLGHCWAAYARHGYRGPVKGKWHALAALTIITVLGCIIIAPFTYTAGIVTLTRKIRIFKTNANK